MKLSAPEINLVAAWSMILAGLLIGFVLGCFFHREEWLGGYGSHRRRLYRLGHLSFFGLGAINLMFYLPVTALPHLAIHLPLVTIGSWSFIAGGIAMPATCALMAHNVRWRPLFVVPVGSVLTGAVLTLTQLIIL